MQIGKTLLAGVFAVAATIGGTARAETLADAMASAYENSGLLEQNRALLRAADEGVATAVGALLPVVTWSANASAQRPVPIGSNDVTANLQIAAELTLYDGGRTQLAIEGQKEAVLATRQSLLDLEQQVLLRVVDAYMEMNRSSEFVALRQNNVRLITQELRAARDRFEVGEVTRTDVPRLKPGLLPRAASLPPKKAGWSAPVPNLLPPLAATPRLSRPLHGCRSPSPSSPPERWPGIAIPQLFRPSTM